MLVHYSPIDMEQHPHLDLQVEAALIEELVSWCPSGMILYERFAIEAAVHVCVCVCTHRHV